MLHKNGEGYPDPTAAKAANQLHMEASPPPETRSATMPAYCYTELCPDARYRAGLLPAEEGVTKMDKVNLFDARKECRLYGKRYPGANKQQYCSCGGFLYITGAYWQRHVGGGISGDKNH